MAARPYVLYGLRNCDACRRVRRALELADVDWRFHDLRAEGVDANQVSDWLERLGAITLLNRRSRAWRELSAAERELPDDASVQALLVRVPTLIRRPLLQTPEGRIASGRDAETVAAAAGQSEGDGTT